MRMIDQTMDLPSRQPAVSLVRRCVVSMGRLFRVMRNKLEVNRLHELSDSQLADIGLSRSDVISISLTSTFFEDPSQRLAQSARERARKALSRGL